MAQLQIQPKAMMYAVCNECQGAVYFAITSNGSLLVKCDCSDADVDLPSDLPPHWRFV